MEHCPPGSIASSCTSQTSFPRPSPTERDTPAVPGRTPHSAAPRPPRPERRPAPSASPSPAVPAPPQGATAVRDSGRCGASARSPGFPFRAAGSKACEAGRDGSGRAFGWKSWSVVPLLAVLPSSVCLAPAQLSHVDLRHHLLCVYCPAESISPPVLATQPGN